MNKFNGMTQTLKHSGIKSIALVVASAFLSLPLNADTLSDADLARQNGRFTDAQIMLESMVEKGGQARADVRALGLLAYLNIVNLDFKNAEKLLERASSIASSKDWPEVKAELANYQGLYHQKLGQYDAALNAYKSGVNIAANAGLSDIEHQAMLNVALLHDQFNKSGDADAQLELLAASLANNSSANAPHWLGAGKLAMLYGKDNAFDLLNKGRELADQQNDVFSQSIANGYLGNLYEKAGKTADALALTDVAISYAQQGDFGNLMVQWEWQRGRIFSDQSDSKRSLAALRRAVLHVEASRQDIPVEYSGGRSSFRETLGPLYSDLARSLLDVAAMSSGEQQQSLYREARQSVELIKRTELEDYFNNRCALNGVDEVVLDNIGQHTASLYPIIFEDRLDILLSINGAISHFSSQVNRSTLSAYSNALASNLREQSDFKLQAQKLYEWIVAPVKPSLDRANIDTIVFLPDGVLRLVPLGMLNSGNNYLIEDFAVVTSPGLSVFDPQPTDHSNFSALLAGLSKPGNVVKDLPNEVLGGLLPKSTSFDDLRSRALANSSNKVAVSMSDNAVSALQDQLAIPGVEREMNRLSAVLPAKTLLNETFTKSNLVNTLMGSPYKVVHVASHGVFGNSAENSFIMAHDQVISMNELESILYSEKFKDDPIELITLSACQTAEGDDRAPLGISGVALKAKVRSAMGSLWSISDDATVKFMEQFYGNLMSGKMTKSEALRNAQISFIKDGEFSHPYFWSPFILIGNWL